MGSLLKDRKIVDLLNEPFTEKDLKALKISVGLMNMLSLVTDAEMDWSWLGTEEGVKANAEFLIELEKLESMNDEKFVSGALMGYAIVKGIQKRHLKTDNLR